MADRKAELERKRQRLQQIREEKKRKEEEKKKGGGKPEAGNAAEAAAAAAAAQAQALTESELERKRREADDLLKDIGLPESAGALPRVVGAPSTPGQEPTKSVEVRLSPRRAHAKLSVSALVAQASIPPKELVQYTKETQTPVPQTQDDQVAEEAEDVAEEVAPTSVADTTDTSAAGNEEEKREVVREMSEEEKVGIISSEEFVKFFDRTARIIERSLAEEEIDLFTDYTGRGDEDKEGEMDPSAKMAMHRQFFDERWSKHRVVTSIDWSPQYPELLVASYNQNEEAPNDPDGVALVWNMKYKKTTPEYIFHCQSAVMSCCFANFHPNLLVGGTYSGQIVLWDNRSNKRTPVQRTPLSAAAHTHPVYCVGLVGTQNAHNLISVSTDGKMCSWSLDMLSQPQDSLELQHKQSKAVAVTAADFPTGDVNNFVVGSEDGSVYTASRHGSKAGIGDLYEGHQGPVTGIDYQHVSGQIDFSHLFLTSSFDWTIKLWSVKQQKPLYSFEDNSDYIYDVAWSPVHPALFASVDGTGRIDIWNLNNDTEVPTASVTVDSQAAVNRVRWAQSGHQLAAGDDDGRLWIYDIGESIAAPRNDEWTRFVHTLADIKANTAENEELALSH